MHDTAHGQAQESVDLPHPFTVPACQVVVYGNQVNAPARQRVEIDGHGRHQGLAFTGFHLGDSALVEDDAANHLDIERPHAEGPDGCFPRHRKGFRKKVVQRFAIFQPPAEFSGLGPELLVAQFANGRFEVIDLIHQRYNALEVSFILTAKDLF